MKKVYSVLAWSPGYMPWDDEPPVFTDKRTAEKYAAEEANRWREEGKIVKGNSQTGYVISDPFASEYHLGWSLEVVESLEETNVG